MTSINLTRAEAQERSAMLRTQHYDITLDLTQGEESFGSRTVVKFEVTQAGDTFIDLRASEATAALNGAELQFSYDPETGIPLTGLTPGEYELVVDATIPYSHTGQGLHRFTDPADGKPYLYTQFETADAKRMFACFDQPDLKATYSISALTPADWKFITNAAATSSVEGGYLHHTAEVDYLLSTYLVAVCAGPYFEVRDVWRGQLTHHPETPGDQPHEVEIPMAIYCRESIAESLDADRLFTETKQGFDWYHRNFGYAYPFGKYDQLFVPEFNMGAMENAGCVTFRDEYVFTSKVTRYRYERRCDTVLHEMAHMWFGDLVTMQWWDDLWLNESFATWSAAISQAEETEYDTAWVTFANVEKSWAYQQDMLPSTHPITADATDIETVEQNFDGITYAKGSSVLKQLQAYVGREAFLAGVRRHFARHAFGNATFDDLLGAFAEASGRDLSGWADQWLKTTGVNRLSPQFSVENGKYTSFAITQSGAQPGAGELRTHRIAVGLYKLVDDQVVRVHREELDVAGELTEVANLIGKEAADLVLVNDDDLTYCILGLDPASLDFVVENIGRIADPMPRTLCWSAAWEMTRAGEMKARDFVALVGAGALAETEIAVLERVLLQATTAVSAYADPVWVDATGRDMLADILLDGVENAEPGSDFQLAFAQALAKVRPNARAISYFESILAGQAPAGLVVDADLRWWALTALIAAGEIANPAEAIAAEQQRDPSAAGQNSAWRATAAIKTEENKASVFAELTDLSKPLSNLATRHKIEGLNFAGAADSLQQFNERYFALADKFWAQASSEVALATLNGIFPSWDISEEGLQRADDFLASDHVSGLVRVVSENRDRIARALRNRKIDAAG
ncbi:aminopeptidase N [Corynebacterium epidermidicanis]|uniref:Aminopeptidase N n=1 Tax=Corynebacterium epidermidicanis TaxID=1050174 RepID=A0A0G3GTD5_9CORY|nr:aminopeptidase N [Corynebacterium epidermidicanis]AKK03805.1 aminopeptidase N [Corynebacterium epidermidicanis]